jgi:pyrroline-5-carboxylate reductase
MLFRSAELWQENRHGFQGVRDMPLSVINSLVLIGAGKMGGAMLNGWLKKGLPAGSVTVVDPHVGSEAFSMLIEFGIRHLKSIDELEASPDVVVLAIKPQQMGEALPALAARISPATLVISIAAGTTLDRLKTSLSAGPVVRVMPNTPAQIGQGMAVAVANPLVSEAQKRLVGELLNAVGRSAWVGDEAMIDVVTAVSGSGPAYVFNLVEAMTAAGVKAGLPHDLAMQISRQTVIGSGALMANSGLDVATLRKNVTSPGGTTAAALAVLMAEGGLEALMTEAVAAAAKRSRELAG